MPKTKTHKGTIKRLRRTGSGKLMHRASGQDHFNSRESGKVTKNKRRDTTLSSASKRLKSLVVHQ
jgi:large subunit ribosomal protein L35